VNILYVWVQQLFLLMAYTFTQDALPSRIYPLPNDKNVTCRRLQGHTDEILAMAFSPDGKVLATSGRDLTIRLWNLSQGSQQAILKTGIAASYISFGADGSILLAANANEIQYWNISSGKKTRTRIRPCQIVGQSPDGKNFLCVGPDHKIMVEEVITGKQISVFHGHSTEIRGAVFLRQGKQVASVDKGGKVLIWNAASGKLVRELPTLHVIYQICVSADEKKLVEVGGYKQLCLLDVDSGKELFSREFECRAIAAAFSPNGELIAVGTEGPVLLLDEKTGKTLKTLDAIPSSLVLGVRFSPDGTVLAARKVDNGILYWRIADVFANKLEK
jgi:WD40 repeat protein